MSLKENNIFIFGQILETNTIDSEKAIKFLLQYGAGKRAFSSYIFIKNKYRNKLNSAQDLRLYLALLEPNFKKLYDSN